MNHRNILVLAVMFFSSVVSAEIKIGYVDFTKTIRESTIFKNEEKKFNIALQATQKKVDGIRKELEKLQSKFERDASIMNEAEKEKIKDQARQKTREMQRMESEFKEDYSRKNEQMMDALQKRVIAISKEIAQEENFDLLLHSVLYASPKIDITDKIMQKMEDVQK